MKKIRIITYFILWLLLTYNIPVKAQLSINIPTAKKPYTGLPDNLGDSYKFIIIGDLTGGEVPGVFDYAVQRINELSPDFVMCVGDLIGGYTIDRDTIAKQWLRLNSTVSKLEMPFFYMSGNHDVANPVLQKVWNQMYGTAYYTFSINTDLFVVLNTFEPGVKRGISEQQEADIKKAILAHPENGRVFVFSHNPMWEQFEKEGIVEIGRLLQKRNATYFCGHEHRYIHTMYAGQPHYMLAGVATEAIRDEAGINLGIYNNLMYISVNPKDVKISNIRLEGLLPATIVDDNTMKQVDMALGRNWAKVIPIVHEDTHNEFFESSLKLLNTGEYPFHITGSWNPVSNGIVSPERIDCTILPGQEKSIPVSLCFKDAVKTESIPQVKLNLKGYFDQPGKDIRSELSTVWTIDNIKQCLTTPHEKFVLCDRFGEIDESWDWHGFDDGNIMYNVFCDDKDIHITIKTIDDILLTDRDRNALQDRVSIYFSADTTFVPAQYTVFDFTAQQEVIQNEKSTLKLKGIRGNCMVEGNSLVASMKIPRKYVKDNTFRLNISFCDLDDKSELDPSVIWWKPKWGSSRNYPQSGVFMIK